MALIMMMNTYLQLLYIITVVILASSKICFYKELGKEIITEIKQ
jgi:hypothetical protein